MNPPVTRLAGVASYAGGNPALIPASCGPDGRPVAIGVLLSQGREDQVVSPRHRAGIAHATDQSSVGPQRG